MSIDFNSVISNALQEATKRRASATHASMNVANPNSMDASGHDSELSMGDIANAIKAKNAQKHDDNKFISTNGKTFRITEDEERGHGIVGNVQDKICAIQTSSEHSYNRQAEISDSLKSYQKDPYVK